VSDRIRLRPLNPSTRLSGHSLQSEGRAYVEDRGSVRRPWSMIRTGFGLCECGARSPELTSDNQRKRWHKKHKEQVRGESALDPA
jgi:hypothetical protein